MNEKGNEMDTTKALFKLTYGLYVVGAKNARKTGGCIVDAVMQTTCTPESLVLCCNKGTWTRQAIQESKEFSLSVLTFDADPFIIGNFGFQSSRDVDKWANVEHTVVSGLPVLKQNAAYLICRVTEFKELSTHVLFFCDVTGGADGTSKALSYTEYQESWKPRVMEAFKAGKPAAQRSGESEIASSDKGEKKMAKAKWVCKVCGYEYDGDVPFEELEDDYVCPVCGVGKDEFEKVEEAAAPSLPAKWVCKVCGYVYDGDVPFEELGDDYACPVCGVGKDQFERE